MNFVLIFWVIIMAVLFLGEDNKDNAWQRCANKAMEKSMSVAEIEQLCGKRNNK